MKLTVIKEGRVILRLFPTVSPFSSDILKIFNFFELSDRADNFYVELDPSVAPVPNLEQKERNRLEIDYTMMFYGPMRKIIWGPPPADIPDEEQDEGEEEE